MERLYNNINNGMCRCCASEGTFKDLSSKYRWMGVEEVYADMLRECFDVTLTYPEENPEAGICEVCITQLRNAANFKKQVLNTEEQFKKMLQNKTNIVKVEVSPPEDDGVQFTDEDNNLSNDDFSSTEYEVPIKTESEEGKSRKRSAKAGPSRSKQPKMEGESSAKRRKPRRKMMSIVPRPAVTVRAKYPVPVLNGDEPTAKRNTGSRRRILDIVPRPAPSVQLTKRTEVHDHQENIAAILSHSNATPLRCRGRFGYCCSYCPKEFTDPADLKTHTHSTHESIKTNLMKGHSLSSFLVKLDITNLTCKICNQSINSLPDFTSHLVSHGKPFNTKIKSHVVPFNFDSETLKCAICRTEFNNFKVLLEHMNKHYTNYVCKVCGAGFVNKRTLQTHGYRHVKGEFKCSTCEKIFDSRVKMKEHERAVHVCRNKRSKCGYCGEMFSDYTVKQAHEQRAHGVAARALPCQACDKRFRNQRALSAHVKLYHLLQGRSGGGGDAR